MSFSEYMMKEELQERYQKVRKYFYLCESAYDVSSACQLRCDGCYYFHGEKYKAQDVRDVVAWRDFFQREKTRGINYVNLAGAEPALVPQILKVCHEIIPLGTVFTNGLKPITRDVAFRIHISIWGNKDGDPIYRRYYGNRPGPYCLPIQLNNYREDHRVIFVYTFNEMNVDQVDDVIGKVSDEGHKITFNIFSAPVGSYSGLRLEHHLRRTRAKILEMMEQYPEAIVYSYYNAEVHTDSLSLYSKFGCPYPRANIGLLNKRGLGSSFRSYRTDLTHQAEADCCVPDTACKDCRHYAAGSAIVTSRLKMHCESEERFRGWLDYVDTYLAIWIPGYELGSKLYPKRLLNS
jgi:hypothetical protein